MTTKPSDIDKFHEHLDACKQCENNPFDLCETGNRLIKEAGDEAVRITAAQLGVDKEQVQ